ncbi:MAG TPA: NHLP leader peptide family RiPP precursor [Ktedonobacteraceae bacterium]|nr:NHLP leader peptide family RiPP precursor [Ktedonobacteraceae bacterium]
MYEQNTLHQQMPVIIEKASKDEAFREQLLNNPKAALERALGITFPREVTIQVHENTPTTLHLVLPVHSKEGNPRDLSDAELERVTGGWPQFLDNAVKGINNQ